MSIHATPGSGPGPARPIALTDLIALNDEIVALSKTGAPLEAGLLDYGRDARGRLAGIANALGHRMSQGAGLADALDAEADLGNVPPLYRAVVSVGIKSGRLTSALEGVARLTQGYAETRRAIGQALVYPLFVLSFTYVLFICLITELVPRVMDFAEGMRLPISGLLVVLFRLGNSIREWAWGLPIALLIGLGIWLMSGRANGIQPGRFDRLAGLIPWTRSALLQARAASFADLIALLIDHEIPLDEAVSLAGEATGEFSFRDATKLAAAAIRRGESTSESLRQAKAIPPLVRWLIASGGDRASMVPALRAAADTYRRRALEHARLVRSALPVVLLLSIGGGAVALYAAALFIPVAQVYYDLSQNLG